LEFVGIGLVKLLKLVGIKIKNPFSNGSALYVCNELAAMALIETELMGMMDIESDGPQELYAQVEALYKDRQ